MRTPLLYPVLRGVPLLLFLTRGAPAQARHPLELTTCHPDGSSAEALCGTFSVPENRTHPAGRTIPLRVVVLRAHQAKAPRDAVMVLLGGPGLPNTYAMGESVLDQLQATRDILLVDQRGTGESNPLPCDLGLGKGGLQTYFDSAYPPREIAACREHLRMTADVREYGTEQAMDDLDDVRAALGYLQVDIIGASYGTRAALVYAQRHPTRVRTLVLNSVAPSDFRTPLYYARDAQASLDGIIGACERTSACQTAYPHFRDDVKALFASASREGVRAQIPDSATGKVDTVSMSAGVFAENLRSLLYQPELMALLPGLVHEAVTGNYRPLVGLMARFRVRTANRLPLGTWLTTTCNEDVGLIPKDSVDQLTQGTFLGSYRVREQQAACAEWPSRPPSSAYVHPVRLSIPTLIVSGEFDPVTPPRWGVLVAGRMPNSVHVVIPGAGHTPFNPCVESLIVKTIGAGAVKGLDVSCVAQLPPLAFEVSPH